MMMKSLMKQLALTLVLAVMSVNIAQAVAPAGKQVIGAIALQGGSGSKAIWSAPSTATYKVHVLAPKKGTTTNVLFRVYPKGKNADSADCVSTDVKFPCYEVIVDQTQYPNTWAQLMLNNDTETQWAFSKGKGYVTAVADNLSAEEILNLSAVARFENTARAIGKNYQGGIIFYLDGTGEHGLIAAPTDQSSGIGYGAYGTTGARSTAVGTGMDNTNKIINAYGEGSYAAKLCADLVIGAYSDWYLPSKDELALMYQNIGRGAAAPLTNVGGFASYYYWSSSEIGASYAEYQHFGDGSQESDSKLNQLYVRAVRSF